MKPNIKISFEQLFVTLIVVLGFSYFFWLSDKSFAVKDIPQDVSEIKMAVISLVAAAAGYVIGTNSASKKKDETISNLASSTNSASVPDPNQQAPNNQGQ